MRVHIDDAGHEVKAADIQGLARRLFHLPDGGDLLVPYTYVSLKRRRPTAVDD